MDCGPPATCSKDTTTPPLRVADATLGLGVPVGRLGVSVPCWGPRSAEPGVSMDAGPTEAAQPVGAGGSLPSAIHSVTVFWPEQLRKMWASAPQKAKKQGVLLFLKDWGQSARSAGSRAPYCRPEPVAGAARCGRGGGQASSVHCCPSSRPRPGSVSV